VNEPSRPRGPSVPLGCTVEPASVHGPPAPVLVAGAGNIFLGDDGFGCEVVARLGERDLPEGVDVRDYGIGGLHLAYDLLEGHRTLLLVDTIARGAEPGSLCLLEVGEQDLAEGVLETHGMDPATVLATLRTMGGRMPRTLVLGCEPSEVVERIGLSTPVGAAVEAAVDAVVDVVLDELAAPPGTQAPDAGTRVPDAGTRVPDAGAGGP
jgi:hydrogenase maturation protease